MALRNLHRQIRPLRYLGFLLLAVSVLLLPPASLNTVSRSMVLATCVLWPVLTDALQNSAAAADARAALLQRLEALLVPFLLALGGLPESLLLATTVCLAASNAALTGARSLRIIAPLLVLGAAVGVVSRGLGDLSELAGPRSAPGDSRGWRLGAALVCLYSLALSQRAFQLTQRLDDHRARWHDRARLLQRFAPPALSASPVAPGRHERRWLTVCVIDLVEFTARSGRQPPEAVGQVLDDLLDTVVDCARVHEGSLDKFLGDGALVFFAAAERRTAVARAIAFVNELFGLLPRLNARWHGFGVVEFMQLRCGIASGFCSLGGWGTGSVQAYTLIGPSVALAHRLQAAAPADGALLCGVSARLLAGADDATGTDRVGFEGELPVDLEVVVGDRVVELNGIDCELHGFSVVRAYRLSAKVRPDVPA